MSRAMIKFKKEHNMEDNINMFVAFSKDKEKGIHIVSDCTTAFMNEMLSFIYERSPDLFDKFLNIMVAESLLQFIDQKESTLKKENNGHLDG